MTHSGKATRGRPAAAGRRDAAGPTTAVSPTQTATAVVVVTICAVAALVLMRLGDPLGVRPDSWSEAEVIVSGLGYAQTGFFAYAGLPQHQIGPPVDPYFLYGNYPVLSNFLYGALHRIGADRLGLYRLPAIAGSLLALWLWYRLVARLVDVATGMAATVALASAFGFLAYADNIHQQAYPLAPQLGALLCAVIAMAPATTNRRTWLMACGACLFVVSLLTIELDAWLMIAIFGSAVLFGSTVRRRWLLLLALPLVAGVGLQWLQERLGSPIPAEQRLGLLANLYRRSIGFAAAADTPSDAGGQLLSLVTYPGFMVQRFRRFYELPIWLLPGFILFGFVATGSPAWPPTRWAPQVKLLVVLTVAPLGWMGTMMQQTAVHPGTLRQFLPLYALMMGVAWTQSLRVARSREQRAVWRIGALLVGLATLVPHGSQAWSALRVHFDHHYHHPLLGEPVWSESVDLGKLNALPPRSILLTNHNRLPLIRYWSRRPAYLAPNALPKGSSNNRNWLELTLNHLRGLYGDAIPQLLYLYRVGPITAANIHGARASDALLRGLTTGSFAPLLSPDQVDRATRAFTGEVAAACPILARGIDWVCFDMTPIRTQLLREFGAYPIPTPADLPAPR